LQELLELTGAAEVVYRTSWSSQNNALLLGKLIYLIQLNRDVIELPWPHMSIVYSKEESEHRINYLDREILLDPSDVPEQVLTILQMIRVGALFEAQVHVDQIARLQESFENAASAIIHTAMRSGTAPQHTLSSDVVISVRRGHTCSITNFYYFLYTMNEQRLFTSAEAELVELGTNNQRAVDSETKDTADVTTHTHSTPHELKRPPLQVRITIEDRYGTKLLEDGSFRIDVRAERDDVYALLQRGAQGLVEQIAQHRVLQDGIALLTSSVMAELDLLSVTPAVGVNEEQFVEFLRRLKAYSRRSNPNRGALLQLHGLKVVVGHYLGVTDDGACVLPWELSLPA
jgi:hypothetical protein